MHIARRKRTLNAPSAHLNGRRPFNAAPQGLVFPNIVANALLAQRFAFGTFIA